MKRTLAKKIVIGEAIKLEGFIHAIRIHSTVVFLEVRDISGIALCVVSGEQQKIFEKASSLSTESVVGVTGLVVASKSKHFEVEVQVQDLTVLSKSEAKLPIQVQGEKSAHTKLGTRLNYRWLDLRKPQNRLIFEVWTTMEQAYYKYCAKNGYINIHSPKILGAPSETGAELFELEYFGRKAYLAQSPQFYKQMAMAAGFERVFEIGPVFRANPSFTVRHDTEFTGYDFEMSYVSSHQEVMEELECMMRAMIEAIDEKYHQSIKSAYERTLIVPELGFPKVTMQEAKKILEERGINSEKDADLNPEEERVLCEYMFKKTGHEFVFVTEYPVSVRPFYHMRLENNEGLTKSFDLLWNGHEVTTGAQREHQYDILVKQAKEKGINLETIQFYLDFFKYGCPPHGGSGIGPTRMLMKVFNIANVREVTFLYRGPNRLTP
jgi:aspartyl-tRNA synthetase